MRHGRMRWEAVRVRARVLSPDRASCAQGKREMCVYTFTLVLVYERARRGGGAARRTVSELVYLYVFRMNTP